MKQGIVEDSLKIVTDELIVISVMRSLEKELAESFYCQFMDTGVLTVAFLLGDILFEGVQYDSSGLWDIDSSDFKALIAPYDTDLQKNEIADEYDERKLNISTFKGKKSYLICIGLKGKIFLEHGPWLCFALAGISSSTQDTMEQVVTERAELNKLFNAYYSKKQFHLYHILESIIFEILEDIRPIEIDKISSLLKNLFYINLTSEAHARLLLPLLKKLHITQQKPNQKVTLEYYLKSALEQISDTILITPENDGSPDKPIFQLGIFTNLLLASIKITPEKTLKITFDRNQKIIYQLAYYWQSIYYQNGRIDTSQWEILVEKTLKVAQTIQVAKAHREINLKKPLLFLWLVVDILKNEKNSTAPKLPQCQEILNKDIAYILITCFCTIFIQPTGSITIRPVFFLNSLLRIIQYHSEFIQSIEIPDKLWNPLFSSLHLCKADAHQYACEHIQHIAEVYTVGHYLMQLTVNKIPLLKRLCEDETSHSNIKKAFTLATITHDIAMLSKVNELKNVYNKIPETDEIIKVLKDESIIELNEGEQINKFTEESEQHNLQAAYLVLAHVNECIKLGADYPKDVILKPAIRAILFHNSYFFSINTKSDTELVAALLVICDVVFPWQPSLGKLTEHENIEVDSFELVLPIRSEISHRQKVTLLLNTPNTEKEQNTLKFRITPRCKYKAAAICLRIAQAVGRLQFPTIKLEIEVSIEDKTTLLNSIIKDAEPKKTLISRRILKWCEEQLHNTDNHNIIIKSDAKPFLNCNIETFIEEN